MWETKISIDYETDKARQEQEQEGARIRHIDRINGGEAVFFSFLLLGSSEVVIRKMKARIQGDRQPGRYAERFSDEFGLASFFSVGNDIDLRVMRSCCSPEIYLYQSQDLYLLKETWEYLRDVC